MIIFPLTCEAECENQIVARDWSGDIMLEFTSEEETLNPHETARFEEIVKMLNDSQSPPNEEPKE